jgi:putative transposase
MLAAKKENYQKTGFFGEFTPAMFKEEFPFLKGVDSLALANVQQHLRSAFEARFSKERKSKNKFPQFKSKKKAKRRYTTNNNTNKTAIVLTDNSIKLPKIGFVKATIHRKPEAHWVLKSATIDWSTDDNFYVSVLFDTQKEPPEENVDTNKAIGLDYASDGLYVDNEGNKGSNHKFFRESQEKLAKHQRRLSKKKGHKKHEQKSNNYIKQLKRVNKIQKHTANQRKDHLHKKSTEIANQYDIVCMENINMKSMSRTLRLGKSTMDNGFGIFRSYLAYKLKERGKILILVDRWYPSSQSCNHCGYRNTSLKDLKIRTWTCPSCNTTHNRDVNAAKNILKEGIRVYLESLKTSRVGTTQSKACGDYIRPVSALHSQADIVEAGSHQLNERSS